MTFRDYDTRLNYNNRRYGGMRSSSRRPTVNNADRNIRSDDRSLSDIEKDFCQTSWCSGCKLVYSDKIEKRFCPECFSTLTKEERDKLFEPDNNISSAEDKVSDDIDKDIIRPNEEGFIPMRRGGNSDAITHQEEAESGGGFTASLPTRTQDLRQKRQEREFPGLDDDLKRMVERVNGKIIKIDQRLPVGDVETLTPDELRNREYIFTTRNKTVRIT